MTADAGARLAFHRIPYVQHQDPVEAAKASAQIDLEEIDTLDPADDRDARMIEYLRGSARRWRQQASELRLANHEAFHARSELPLPSPLCVTCNPTGEGTVEYAVPDL